MNQILRMAASRVGYSMDRISDPGDPAHQLVSENFATVVRTELENYAWHWSDSERSFPCYEPEDHECQYQAFITVSEDIVRIRKVHQCGRDVRYDRHGDRLLLWDLDKGQQVTVRGQWSNDISSWPESFKEIIVCRFAGMIGSSLTQRPDLGQFFDARADLFLERAKAADSQQQTAQRIVSGRIAARRRTPYTSPAPPAGPAGGSLTGSGGGGTSPGGGGGVGLHADLPDTDTDGHPGTVINIPGGVAGNVVTIAADETLQDSGSAPSGGVPEAPNDGIHKLRRTLSGVSTWESAGGAALLNVGAGAGDVASGNAPALAVANHEAAPDPHGQYPLTSTLGNASVRNVGTGSGDVAAGDAPAGAVAAHEATFNHERVKVSASDTTADYLRNQVQSGDGSIVFSIVNPGANEVLDMRSTGAGGGEANENQNVGTGEGLIARDKVGVFNNVRSIKTTASITVATVGDTIELTGIENPINDGDNYARSTSVGGSSTWVKLGDSSLRTVGTGAGDVAAGNAPAAQVAVHEAAGNPHSQYPLSSSLGDSATRNVGAGAGDVAAGDAPAASISSHESSFPHPTTDQKAAMDGASAPNAGNPFATNTDLFSKLHADLTDLATSGHPGTAISVPGTPGNTVRISAGNTLEDSGTGPGGDGLHASLTDLATSGHPGTVITIPAGTLDNMVSIAADGSLKDSGLPAVAAPVSSVSGQYSISASPTTGAVVVNLTNDTMTPGNSKYYGTNATGTRGWFDLPGAGGGWVDGTTVTDWGLGVQNLGSLGAGTSAVDLDNGHHITATLTADRTFNFSSTTGHAVTQWTATIATGGNTPTFQFGGVAVDPPADYDISGSPQRIHFTFVRDTFGVSVLERRIP